MSLLRKLKRLVATRLPNHRFRKLPDAELDFCRAILTGEIRPEDLDRENPYRIPEHTGWMVNLYLALQNRLALLNRSEGAA